MSILDDAIREHLELKRQHGAPDDEVKKLEDEAFGPPARPDGESESFTEAATEFMTLPETGEVPAAESAEVSESEGRRIPDIADLQEAPPAPEPVEEEAPIEDEAPAEEEHPAMEHEVVEEEPAGSHTTEERHAIAEQPTQMFDVESELADDAQLPATADEPAPSDEEILDSELSEPRLAPIDPLDEAEEPDEAEAPLPAAEAPAPEFDDDDFFDEQRLSDELDQALEAPAPAAEAASPATEEAEFVELDEAEEDEEISEEHTTPEPASHKDEHEDVLEDTPDFLEESPEDDQLWFEQKPPKDFDFDD